MVLAATLLLIPLMGLVVAFGIRTVQPPAMDRMTPAFNPASAMEYARTLAIDYPDRVTGSAQAGRAAEYLRSEFQKLGYRVSGDMFSIWLAGHRVVGDSVIAELKGEIPESVAVIAHYDGQRTSHQAAEDNASGVGVMLELARAMRSAPRRRGLIFVATDAEEWGMLGARDLRGFFRARGTLAVISIDYLTRGPSLGIAMGCEGQRRGYTPLWLRELVGRAGAVQGVQVEGSSPLQSWMERAVEVSAQDQGPLLTAGIPAINLSTISPDVSGVRARYHTFDDVFTGFDPATFKMVGDTVEQAVTTLNFLEPPPPPEVKYLLLTRGRWLDRTTLEWLQTLGLLPFVLACALAVLNFEHDRLPHPGWSYLRPAFYLIPLLGGLAALHALTSTGVLPRYELYPATPKDPFLYSIPARMAAPLAGAVLAGYVLLRVLRRFLPPAPGDFAASKRILCVWTFVIAIWALYLDPFAMWLFLGPLFYAVILLQRPSNLPARVSNALVLAAAAAPFVGLLYYFGQQIYLGWRILWYVVLQTAYGVWSTPAVLLVMLAVVVWTRLFYLTVLGRPLQVRHPAAPKAA